MANRQGLILLLICGIISISIVKAQDSNLLKRFANSTKYKAGDNYILLEIDRNLDIKIKNEIFAKALRQLSEYLFIIESKNVENLQQNDFNKKRNLANDLWKISPGLEIINSSESQSKHPYHFTISFNNEKSIVQLISKHPSLKSRTIISTSQKLISFYGTYEEIEKIFLHNEAIISIDVSIKPPKEELAIGGFDLSANKINLVHSRYPLINGSGQHVSIKENYYDTADIDIKGRLDPSPLKSSIITNHANFIATIIAGAGNSVYYAKGAAWAANISSSSFDQVLPDATTYYNQYNITVQNHSYGTGIENYYGLNAVAFDKSANENPSLLHVFSSGNSGDIVNTSGNYSGIPGFANLTGNFKMSKNTISVGASDSFGNVVIQSSKGPAFDGRIKPEIIAFETNGTSEAAALVSGTALLLQQFYKTKNSIVLPSALAKAILVNAADDVNKPGPDYATGFGSMNAFKAMNIIRDNNIISGSVSQGVVQAFSINIPPNISQIKLTLSWNDTAALAFAPKALVNDLDLTLISSATSEVWKPWVLSSFPHIDSLNKLPQRKRDSLNNIEQVTLQNPVSGNYQIKVQGFTIPSTSQIFYVAYSMDTANTFQWHYPSSIDFLETGRSNILRWESNFSGIGTGNIEYSFGTTNAWIPVTSNTDLAKKYFYWTPPDTTVQAILRMKIGTDYYYSDTFLITSLPAPKVGYVCSDTVFLYWNKIKGVTQYEVYQLGSKYMDPLVKVSDTAVFLLKSSLTSKYFSVGSILPNGVFAPKSYAFDYTLQGTGCYIQTFFAVANGNIARLTLLLGTTYNIRSIVFQKYSAGNFIKLDSFAIGGQTTFIYNYQPLTPGITLFRVKITLQSGEVIYSNISSVFYVEPTKYILLPNPVKRNSDIEILLTIPDQEVIHLFDVSGRQVLQKEIQSAHEYIKTSLLQPGQYFYRIIKNAVIVSSGKIIIL